MDIRFDLSGFSEYEVALARMVALLTDLRLFWPRLVPVFIGWMREQFETEGAFLTRKWAPLSSDYLARKMRDHPGRGILYASGDLRQAASRPRRIATPTSLTFVIDDSSYTHGTNEPRSVIDYHQEGTDRMPARPLLPREDEMLPVVAREEVEEAAQEWIDEMAVKLGLR